MRKRTRRNVLQAGAGVVGITLPGWLNLRQQSQAARTAPAKASSCIVIYCWGGMSHHESFDPKPDAPIDIRGQFVPISTATTGIQISEHLPLIARHTDKLAIIRSEAIRILIDVFC